MAYGTLLTDTIKSSTSGPVAFQNTSGTEVGTLCRAWVQFVGSTAVINASFNVSSVTRSGTGDYLVNFTNAMTDNKYSTQANCQDGTGNVNITKAGLGSTFSTTQVEIAVNKQGTGAIDSAIVTAAVFR